MRELHRWNVRLAAAFGGIAGLTWAVAAAWAWTWYSVPGALVALPMTATAAACFGWWMVLQTSRRGDNETRCRACGHILRGLTEPRCPECGERI